jgi:RND family efflux transporter MFP subunit
MKSTFALGACVLVLVGTSFAAGIWWSRESTVAAGAQASVHYACPMHPQYRRDHPGDCPTCGMRLEAVRASDPRPSTASGTGVPPRVAGAIHVSSERQQAIGVRLGRVERVSGTRMLRTTGRVAPDENATYAVVAGTGGWIRTVGGATTGTLVRKNERLASFYSPEFAAVLQSYYSGLDTFDRTTDRQLVDFNRQRVIEGVQRFADTLRNMGVSEPQLEEMRTSREHVQDIYLTAPVDGFVLQRNVSAGLRFDRGFEFYRIADLRRVWILADVFQHQRPFVRPRMTALISASRQSRPIPAVVSDTEPVFDQATLTLTLRLETDNPGFALKPGMFVDVQFPVELPPALVVPADAIVDSGLRKIVFVDLGDGYFEPRQIETGWRIDDQVEITGGLMPGDRIVMSGTFLIDSESRMRATGPAPGSMDADRDPVCGMTVSVNDATAAARKSDFEGRRYYFCSDGCKRTFEASPAAHRAVRPN